MQMKTPQPVFPAFRPLPHQRHEHGAILILVMLVLLILATVVLQIWFTADVDKQIAVYQKNSFPLRQAAQGAFMNACSILVQDMQDGGSAGGDDELDDEGDTGDDDGSGLPGGDDPSDGSGEGFGDEGDGGLGMGGEGSEQTDSLIDSWAQPGESGLAFTSDVEVQVLIRDEDAKFNILSILSRDEDFQEKSMERLVRLIDLFRENTRGDLSRGTALEVAESIRDWMQGDRKSLDFPTPLVKTGKNDRDREEVDDDEPREFPLTMEELVLCENVTYEILYGYNDQRERIPGLIEYITIYSNLIMDELRHDEEEEGPLEDIDDPFGDDEEDSYGGTPEEDDTEGSTGDDEGQEDEVAQETNNGLINVNTAPLPVLKALMDESDLSYSVLDQLEEFREKAQEKYDEEMDQFGWDDEERRFGDGTRNEDDDDDEDDEDDSGSAFDDDEDEDFIFKDPYNVMTRLEEYFEADYDLDKDIDAEFHSLLEVKSNIFTVYVIVKSPDGRDSKTYRAVVWRRAGEGGSSGSMGDMGDMDSAITGSDSGQIVILVPLEEYSHPIPFREGEEEAMEGYY